MDDSFNIAGCERVMRNHCPPPGKSIGSKLPAHIIGDVIEVYEFVQRFYDILGFQETPSFSFKELEEELTCSGVDLNVTQEVNNKVSAQGLVMSNDTLLSDIHIKLLKLLMHEMQLPRRKKGTGHLISAKGCQLHVLVNELTWPEMARRYVLGLMSIKRSLAPVEIKESDKSKVFRCLQGDGRVLCGSITGVEGIEEDVKVLVEAIKTVFGSFDTENYIQHVHSESSGTTIASDKGMLMDDDDLGWSQELEPVRKLRTNVGSRIRDCIHKALDKRPPLWAKKMLDHSISKDVYKGNSSAPTKNLVILVLDKLCSKDLNQQPNKGRNNRNSLLQSKVIMRRCHFALRRSLADDKNKVFCNILSGQLLMFVENAEEGILESSVKVSHPLDFRTIDVRLEAGAYGTSYDAFLDDVRQVWANLRLLYANKPELVKLADKLSEKFEGYYENEVKSLFQKYGEYVDSDYTRLKKEMDDILTSTRELPKSPWKQNSCKVCGIDKDNKSVLLCDRCEAGYHTYCLEPPLKGVPRGDWFCHRCVKTSKEGPETTDDALLPANLEDLCDNDDALLPANLGHLCDNDDALLPANLEDLCDNDDALLPANLEDLCDNDVIKGLEPLAAMTQKEYCEWGLDERVFLLKFLCDEVLNSSAIRKHLEKSIDLRRECSGVDSSGRLYWILSEPFLTVEQIPEGFQMATSSKEENLNYKSSLSFPWVSYQSEDEIEELLGWLNVQDERERLLKESILKWKKSDLHDPKNNENQGKYVLYERRNNFSGMKATSLLAAKCAPPYGLKTTESGNEKVEKGKETSSSVTCEEHKEQLDIELKPLFGKNDIFLRQLKMKLLDIEAALPEGALIQSKSLMERRYVWRAFVESAATILETIQAVISLEDMIKIEYLKNWWCYWSSLWAAVKTPTMSALALRIYSLDAAIEYETK
ncbi:methyl-CpG-binding domain-containing protein 9-like [Impatiens glandulifera]|uniref:methyl-CpG-binding domain-containing protein 9-like n=1 Tax=Impatiens glandulifera TaxID=253017 RepID=UPI001FB19954|nr:methyl-CpG-binding domain-containing protein 9-like [Impatiens glandulifera]